MDTSPFALVGERFSLSPIFSTTEKSEEQQNPQSFVADEVSSFMEAKEFFITNFGVQRSDVASKDAVAALCKEYNVSFPNYPL